MARRERLVFKTVVPWSARRAAHVFAISERTRDDLVELYGIQPDKITVTPLAPEAALDRKSTRLNSSHANISYAVFCLKKKKNTKKTRKINKTLTLNHTNDH